MEEEHTRSFEADGHSITRPQGTSLSVEVQLYWKKVYFMIFLCATETFGFSETTGRCYQPLAYYIMVIRKSYQEILLGIARTDMQKGLNISPLIVSPTH